MRRLVSAALLLLFFLAVLPVLPSAQAQGAPTVAVKSQYILDRYGFATINESVMFANNGSSAVQVPSLTFGIGNLSSDAVAYSLAGSGFTLGTPASTGGPFTVSGGQSLQAGSNSSFVLSVLLNGVVSTAKNGSLEALTLSSPSISTTVKTLQNVVQMPTSTSFESFPVGLGENVTSTSNSYTSRLSNVAPQSAETSVRAIAASSVQDFHPLRVYGASRMFTAGSNGDPIVTDTIKFQNLGTTPLTELYVTPLTSTSATVTILASTEPRLISPYSITLASGGIDLSLIAVNYPNSGVQPGANFTVSYQYPLSSKYYSAAGGQVTISMPESPPIKAFVDKYTIGFSLPKGTHVVQAAPSPLANLTPWQTGQAKLVYALSVGWALDASVPTASIVFLLLLLGLFVSRTTTAEVEETEEEESSSELASSMIKAFDDKTDLINGLWPEIEGKDPNELNKAYFDELRGRLDTFRNKAIQRLNEVKQKSTSQKFSEVVNQIHATERELDRAAKDKLNLYQQYYLRQMRKEVYDRLLPQYTKRLEKALNQLSDELHIVQREAKLL